MASQVTLVWGPPCGGKSTYVDDHRQAGDVVIDYDRIAQALGSPHSHDHPPTIVGMARTLLRVATASLATTSGRVWVVKCDPTPEDRAAATDDVLLDPGIATCLARASTQRPERWAKYVREWYAPKPVRGGRARPQ